MLPSGINGNMWKTMNGMAYPQVLCSSWLVAQALKLQCGFRSYAMWLYREAVKIFSPPFDLWL